MMVRTQITLESEDHRRAKQRAAQLGISLAAYLRRLVADDLGGDRPKGDVSQLFDLGGSGGSDISRHKDEYIGEAVEGLHGGEKGRRRGR